MKRMRVVSLAVICAATCAVLAAQETAAVYQGADAERYLAKAQVKAVRELGQGVTRPMKVTLELGGVTRFAVFKSIDLSKAGVTRLADGSHEVDFQDSWQTEIAAYEIDKLLGLGMVPATIERRVQYDTGSLQWWVESMMPEAERIKKGIEPPDREAWNRTMLKAILFDQLIANVDRHMNNLLVTKDFDIRLIDHSRSFRTNRELKEPDKLTRFSKSLLERIEKLDIKEVKKRVGRFITIAQIDRMMQRRDAILALARKKIAEHGEAAVIYP